MSKGKYKITNDDIFYAIEKEFLSGFSKEKITKSEKFKVPSSDILIFEAQTEEESAPVSIFAGTSEIPAIFTVVFLPTISSFEAVII